MRGEYHPGIADWAFPVELPPRARRIPLLPPSLSAVPGTTSACAENTSPDSSAVLNPWNYLRVRGEYLCVRRRAGHRVELPPRARRIPFAPRLAPVHHGTTSACAENTQHAARQRVSYRNYLRVRGEYMMRMTGCPATLELPPRARRIHRHYATGFQNLGTTSACAENTPGDAGGDRGWGNYLRVRGEYSPLRFENPRSSELPPRARRIRRGMLGAIGVGGTTSACAENTVLLQAGDCGTRNYLRVRGEYKPAISRPPLAMELPPRARRIQLSDSAVGFYLGTTSACAENTGGRC